MRLYLIRHAESQNNEAYGTEDEISGHKPDPDLTDAGHAQCDHLARFMVESGNEARKHPSVTGHSHDFELTHIYCSLMTRSLLTAEYLFRRSGIVPVVHPEIYERKGLYTHDEHGNEIGVAGPGRDYFHQRFNDYTLPEDIPEGGWWNRPVEDDPDFVGRVSRSMDDIINRHAGGDDVVALVVHSEYIDQAINDLLNVHRHEHNYNDLWLGNWVLHNTSITRIDINGPVRNVIYLNRVDHLPAELITW